MTQPDNHEQPDSLSTLQRLLGDVVGCRKQRYEVTVGHPAQTDGVTEHQASDMAQQWFTGVYAALEHLGYRPRSLITGLRRGHIETKCTLRLDGDIAAMGLKEALEADSCEHTVITVLPRESS